jgi:hypothetical protein
VARGAWVPYLAIAEVTWVLEWVYERDSAAIATAADMLLNHEQLSVQDSEVVEAAVVHFDSRRESAFPTASWWRSPGKPDTHLSAPSTALSERSTALTG